MQRTATAGFYAGFVGQGIEYTQIISNADYQLSMIITSAKGVNSINNPLSYLLFIKDFSLTQTIDAAKAGLQDAWNGTYDSAIGRKIGAGTFNYLLMTIGGAQLKGKGTACEAVESGTETDLFLPDEFYNKNLPNQVAPGTKYLPKYDELGNVKQIKMYDDYGREIGWVDYTNHGYGDINSPHYHTTPHWHEKIYNAQYPDGIKINHRTDVNTPLGDK